MTRKNSSLENKDLLLGLRKSFIDLYEFAWNKWCSNKEHNIVAILESHKVHHKYSRAIGDVLGTVGMFEKIGHTQDMSFRISSKEIPDVNRLAQLTVERNIQIQRDYKANLKSSENQPKASKTQKEFIKNGDAKKVERPMPTIASIVYVMRENRIIEGKICGIFEDCGEIFFNIRIKVVKPAGNIESTEIKNIKQRDLFETPQLLAEYLVYLVNKNK